MKKKTQPFLLATAFALPLIAIGFSAPAEAGFWDRPAGPADLDGDGVVTRFEMRAYHLEEARILTRRIDVNRDGWLSPTELRRARVGRRNDIDLDGRVTGPERRAARQGRWVGISAARFRWVQLKEARMWFDELDTNEDGVVTRRELRRGRRAARREARYRDRD